MSDIRVTYSGLISFAVRLTSVITGIIFTIIVTRQLTVEEFGTWGVINGLIIYATIISPVTTYWLTREIARGEKSGMTGLTSASLLSLIGILIYFVASFFVGNESDADLIPLLIASIIIPVYFIDLSLTAITLGSKPESAAISLFVFEITKIPLGLFFIYFLEYGLEGAIFAVFFATIAKILTLGIFTRKQLREKFQIKFLQKWIKLFWLPVYRGLPALLAMSDVVIFSIMTGSVVGVAYYTSAKTVGMLVNHVRAFSTGVYPKLLETEKQEFLKENLNKLLYFALPLTAFSIVFAEPALYVLNPAYKVGSVFVIFLSLRMFLKTLNQVFFQALQGIDKIDKNENATFKEFLKSKLVWIPTFDLIRHGVYAGSLAGLIFILSIQTEDTLELVFYWSLIGFLIEIPITIYTILITRKSFSLSLNFNSLIKYVIVSLIVFTITFFIMNQNLEYTQNIFEFIPILLLYVITSFVVYIIITYLIDKKTRIFINSILHEIIKK